jgi:tryptophan synthase beta chain
MAIRQHKYLLDESEMPTSWYNIIPDLPAPPPPPLHPATGQPIGPEDLAPLFPMALIMQEVTGDRYVDIPGEVLDVYRLWRPSPLFRARRLERALDTPAKIYYKYEGVSPVGSHKPNTAVPQAFYNAAEGVTKLTTETGAGQWGSALAFASSVFGLECEVWQVRASYDQKPYRRLMMETYGASVHPQPVRPDRLRPHDPQGAPGLHRQPRHRDQRGRGTRRFRSEHAVRAGQRAQPRADAPDGDRRGGPQAVGHGR